MMRFELGLPSVFWLVLILGLIPGVQAVLEQFFPSTEYWYSALVVAVLGAVAKAVQVTYGGEGRGARNEGEGAPTTPGMEGALDDLVLRSPAAAARPERPVSQWQRWLF
jgi:hypothetical protein